MSIDFRCPKCTKLLRVPDGSEGQSCECPACSAIATIPGHVAQTNNPQTETCDQSEQKTSVPCPKCLHLLVCSTKLLGTRGHCPQCGYVFTIQTDSSPILAETDNHESLIFNCPNCNQLFEGKSEMHGRKGKCHVCQSVFIIEIKKAAARNSPAPQTAPTPLSDSTNRQPPSQVAKPRGEESQNQREKTVVVPQHSTAQPAASQSTRRGTATEPSKKASSPIRFACHACTGVLEVPGSTAGLETACPFCNKILKIPEPNSSESAAATKSTRPKSLRASSGQPVASQSLSLESPAVDPFAVNNNPYADPLDMPNPFAASAQQTWQTASTSKRRIGTIAFDKTFNILLDRSFPACLYVVLQALVAFLPMITCIGILYGIGWIFRTYGIQASENFRMVLSIAIMLMWISTAFLVMVSYCWMMNLSLHTVRKGELTTEVFFGGAHIFLKLILVSVLAAAVSALISFVPIGFLFAGGLAGSAGFTVVGLILMVIALPVLMLPYMAFMFAPYAMLDGDGIVTAIGTSLRIFTENWLTILGSMLVFMCVHVVLSIVTLGLASGLPFFLVASMYTQVRPKAPR